jgi:MoaA/NifB/PqqE/SkfB family radical SAM enzyme
VPHDVDARAGGPAAARPRRWLELTPDYRCNQRCVGCGVINEGGPSLSSRELVLAMIDGRRQGITQLWIGGGEPTLRRDLLPCIREARARGYTRVRLQTNAAMLAYPEVAQRLAAAGLTDVAVSIKGPDARTHDRMARTEGAFDLLCRGIANAKAAGLSVDADVLVYRSTTAQLPDVVRVFHGHGIERFRVWMMAPAPSDPEALAEEPRLAEVARAVEAALALGLSDDPEHVLSLHTPPCTLDTPRARFFAPDLGLLVHDATGRRFMLEESGMEGGTFPARCSACALRDRCTGVRADYLSRHGDDELRPRRAE